MMAKSAQNRTYTSRIRQRVAKAILSFAILCVSLTVVPRYAEAQNLTVLYSFTGGLDGSNPFGRLARDDNGNFYGTTVVGGAKGQGAVFMLDAAGNETVLYSFLGLTDGASPFGGLVRDSKGNLYGTTQQGGDTGCDFGCGTVFRVSPAGKKITLHTFTGGSDGGLPEGELLRDSAGNLYGTSGRGGSSNYGIVYKLDPHGNETVLHNFVGYPSDGANPAAGVVMDTSGNLYGAASGGGEIDHGVVYKIDRSGNETIIYSFAPKPDGWGPYDVVLGTGGKIYGTTSIGGLNGNGAVFAIDTRASVLIRETVLYSFGGQPDGVGPLGIVWQPGEVYGMTVYGGDPRCSCGTVYSVDAKGNETIVHSFTGVPDGDTPGRELIRDSAGDLYGVTTDGGAYGYGAVFKLTP